MAPRSDPDSNEACTEFVRAAISIMPSVLERLVYLASLRDRNTGEYQDQVLEALLALKFGKGENDSVRRSEQIIGFRCGKTELDRALRREHMAVFCPVTGSVKNLMNGLPIRRDAISVPALLNGLGNSLGHSIL